MSSGKRALVLLVLVYYVVQYIYSIGIYCNISIFISDFPEYFRLYPQRQQRGLDHQLSITATPGSVTYSATAAWRSSCAWSSCLWPWPLQQHLWSCRCVHRPRLCPSSIHSGTVRKPCVPSWDSCHWDGCFRCLSCSGVLQSACKRRHSGRTVRCRPRRFRCSLSS